MVRIGDPEFRDIAIDDESIGSWSVTVERNGEQVVTIASNHLSGRDITPADAELIQRAARHLLSFLGDRPIADVHRLALAEALTDKWDARATVLTSDFRAMRDDRLKASILRECAADLSAILAIAPTKEENAAELERQKRDGIGVFNPRFDSVPPARAKRCHECEHPMAFHTAVGCGIEECGCNEAHVVNFVCAYKHCDGHDSEGESCVP